MPLIPSLRVTVPELIGIGLPELQASLTDRLIRHNDPASEQEPFDVPVAQTEAIVPSDAMADDLGREPVPRAG